MKRFAAALFAAALCLSLCAQQKADRLALVDGVIGEAISAGTVPGAVLAVMRGDDIVWLKAYGNRSVTPSVEPMTTDTMFDLASCSKVMGTTLAFMKLVENGQVRIEDNVSLYIPGFAPWTDPGTGEQVQIKVRDLMTHSSGLAPYIDVESFVKEYGENCPGLLEEYIATKVKRNFRPGTDCMYSCLNFITLQRILEKVTGQKLYEYAHENIFAPLALKHTCYFPLQDDLRTPARHNDLLPLVAPTEVQSDGSVLLGAVHDPLARLANGGNSGNAGVFSDAVDLSRICMTIMNNGYAYKDKKLGFPEHDARLLSRAAVRLMTTVPPENAPSVGRALGWDVSSEHSGLRGDLFNPETTLMHTGYTGTSLVIDLDTHTAIVLLTNRVHPHDDGSAARLRALVSNIVAGAIHY